jgi:thiosulfate/3-mercaptopyruvate sulfurtransferase
MFRTAGVAPGDLVVTYCNTGVQASFLYFVARYLGHDVRMYDGSFAEWKQLAGMPIESP